MKTTLGFSTTSGLDYEVALCYLVLLCSLTLVGDFFLVGNLGRAGKFNGSVLLRRLEGCRGRVYGATLLPAEHRETLKSSDPIRLKDPWESFKELKRLSGRLVFVQRWPIELQESSLVVAYKSVGCEIGEAAGANIPEVQLPQDSLGAGRWLLRTSEAQPRGEGTSRLFPLSRQMSYETANSVLREEELNCHAEKFGLEITIPGRKMLLEGNQNLHLQNLQGLAVAELMPVDKLPRLSISEEKLAFDVNREQWYFPWRQRPRHLLICGTALQDGFHFVTVTFNWSLFDGFPLYMAQGGGRLSALHVAATTRSSRPVNLQLLMPSGEDLSRKDDVSGGAIAVKYTDVLGNREFADVEERANIADVKIFTVQNRAVEVLIYLLVSLCWLIWQPHSNSVQNLHLPHFAAVNNSKHVKKFILEKLREIDKRTENGCKLFRTVPREQRTRVTVGSCGEVRLPPEPTATWRRGGAGRRY